MRLATPASSPDAAGPSLTRRPLTIVHTGPMRGKSTAAFGLAMRAWAAGMPVGVYQFVKGGGWRPGERTALEALGDVHAMTGTGAPVDWHTLGGGGSWTWRPGEEADHATLARRGWLRVSEAIAELRYGCYVLDELTYPMTWGWLDADEIVATLRSRKGFQHVIVTGRDADPRLIEAADMVVEMTKVKHPLDAGHRGQRGIEW